ncbi:MAG: S1/P1 nuclease [Lysobacteraceae bacterium]
MPMFVRPHLSAGNKARLIGLALASLLAMQANPALAWGNNGHRMVGYLAERELTPATRAQIADLLRGEADPTLAGVANWADTLRNDDPARFKQTRRWHYMDFPRDEDCTYVAPRDCPGGNCMVDAIHAQQQVLANPQQSRQARIEALKFLVHFVGDVHQPLHAGYKADRGGNDFQISLRTAIAPEKYAREKYIDGVQGTNLHSVWDFYILAEHSGDARRYADELAARRRFMPDLHAGSRNPADWAMESCRIVRRDALYPSSHKMDSAYLDKMRPIAEWRVIQAGDRLAQLLNDTLAVPVHAR